MILSQTTLKRNIEKEERLYHFYLCHKSCHIKSYKRFGGIEMSFDNEKNMLTHFRKHPSYINKIPSHKSSGALEANKTASSVFLFLLGTESPSLSLSSSSLIQQLLLLFSNSIATSLV